jgi:hypothetical protein
LGLSLGLSKSEAAQNLDLDLDLDVVLDQFVILNIIRSEIPASKGSTTRSRSKTRSK